MANLSDRQLKILKALIEAFISEAEPVGSESLVEDADFSFSPATVRNEMAILSREGFIEKPHTSAGRVPTERGIRFYIASLMEEHTLPVLQEVGMKQRVFQHRHSFERMLREAALSLAEATGYLAIITTHDGQVFYGGPVNLLEHPEFYDIRVTRSALELLDRYEALHDLFVRTSEVGEVKVLVGREIGQGNLDKAGLVFAHFGSEASGEGAPKQGGVVAVLGPYRMNYAKVIPQVRCTASILSELSQNL
jgi:transcriptional regulator of heat shock response